MSYSMMFTAVVLLAGGILFASGRFRMDLIALGMAMTLFLGGVLDAETLLSGFAAPATITLASIYVISGGMRRSGATALIGRWLLRAGRSSPRRLTGVLLLATGALSAFMLNLAAMVIMLPVGLRLSRASNLKPGKLLLPLGLFAILGGYITLLGTTPNLIVSDLLAQRTGRPLGLFEPALIGLPVLLLSLIWVIWFGQRLLPNTGSKPGQIGPNLQQLERTYGLTEAFYRLRVRSISQLAGLQLQELDLRKQWDVNIIGVAPPGGDPYQPWPEMALEVNDEIIVRGRRANVLQVASLYGLEPKEPASLWDVARLSPAEMELAEVLVPPYSPLVGHTLAELDFDDRYGLNVLAILRDGRASAHKLLETPLEEGDRLLAEGSPKQFLRLRRGKELVVLSDLGIPAEELISRRSTWMLGILAAVVLVSVSGLIALPVVTLLGALAAILTGCTSAEDAYKDVDWSVVVLVAALLPLGVALENTGLSAALGEVVAVQLGALGPQALLAMMFVLTVLLTQILANMVVAMMLAPLAFDIAQTIGVSPTPFAIAILFGVGTAFLTPITEVINLLVRKPGGYRFRDYLLLNLPVATLIAVAVIWLGPLIWPF